MTFDAEASFTYQKATSEYPESESCQRHGFSSNLSENSLILLPFCLRFAEMRISPLPLAGALSLNLSQQCLKTLDSIRNFDPLVVVPGSCARCNRNDQPETCLEQFRTWLRQLPYQRGFGTRMVTLFVSIQLIALHGVRGFVSGGPNSPTK